MSQVHCPACGEGFADETDQCPACGVAHLPRERIGELRDTAEKRHGAGQGLIKRIPLLLPLVAWRQERIEDAERALISYWSQFGRDGERVHCRECGAAVAADAETCGDCGEENVVTALSAVDYDIHVPTGGDPWAGDRLWALAAAGPYLGLALWGVAGAVGLGVGFWSAVMAGSTLGAVAFVLDRDYLAKTAPWKPSFWWSVAFLWPPVNFLGPLFYLWKRVDVLGLGEHLA